MADSLQVIATFDVETGGFDAKREEIVQGLTEMEQAAKGAQVAADKLSGSTGVLTSKVGSLATAQEEAAKTATQLSQSGTSLGSVFKSIGTGIKDFALGARDGFKQAIAEVGGLRGILTQTFQNIKGLASGTKPAFDTTGKSVDQLKARIAELQKQRGGLVNKAAIAQTNKEIASVEKTLGKLSGTTTTRLGGALNQVKQNITGVVSSIPGIGGLAAALGPVGLAAGAVAGGLFAIVRNTDAGATALDGLAKGGGLAFDRITGVASRFFDTLTSGTSTIGKVFSGLSKAVEFFVMNLTPIGAIFQAISETELFKGLKEDFKTGQEIAQLFDDVDEAQRKNITSNAKLDAQYKQLNVQLRDKTKTDQERIEIADKLTAIEEERAANEIAVLKQTTAAIRREVNEQIKNKGQADDDLDRRLREAEAAEIDAQAESTVRLEKAENRKSAILDAAEQKRQAAAQKAREAREKAEQVAAQKAEQRQQAEAKLNETLEELAAESRNRQLTDAEREVEAVRKKYADLEKVTLEGIQKLREAAPANEQSVIAAKEAEALLAIDKAKAEELAALRAEASQAAQEQLRVALQTEEEIRREAVLKDFDERVALAEQFVEDEAERNAVILELTRIAEEELTAITQEGVDARIAAAEAETEALKRAEEAKAQIRATEVQSAIGTTQALGDFVQAAAGQNEEAAKVALGIQKAVAIANIIVQTQAATAAALAQSVLALGPIAGPPAAAPTIALLQTTAGLSIGAILAQAITGAYTGEERVGSNGERPVLPGTRDRYLRRVHKDEGILDAETNLENLPALNAMRRGTFDEWVDRNYILPAIEGLNINDDAKVVRWSQGDMGERMARSIALPRMFDRGIVGAVNGSRKEQAQTNALLQALVHNTRPRRTNSRYN